MQQQVLAFARTLPPGNDRHAILTYENAQTVEQRRRNGYRVLQVLAYHRKWSLLVVWTRALFTAHRVPIYMFWLAVGALYLDMPSEAEVFMREFLVRTINYRSYTFVHAVAMFVISQCACVAQPEIVFHSAVMVLWSARRFESPMHKIMGRYSREPEVLMQRIVLPLLRSYASQGDETQSASEAEVLRIAHCVLRSYDSTFQSVFAEE